MMTTPPTKHNNFDDPRFEGLSNVVHALYESGLSPEFISQSLNITHANVKQIIHFNVPRERSASEQALADEVRELAFMAVKKAKLMLEFGPTDQKLAVVKALLPNLARLYSSDNSDQAATTRSALEELLATQRSVPELTPFITDDEIIDVDAQTATIATLHPDKIIRD